MTLSQAEATIKKYRGEIVEMNIPGRGTYSADKVHDYPISLGELKYCVVDISSEKHIQELMESFRG